MSSIIQPLIDILQQLASVWPLPWFTFVGAFVEELIAPIPSPLVMTLAGSLAAAQGSAVMYLGFLALIGSIGKTIGSYLVYVIADKGESFFTGKWGKYLGLSSKDIETIGKQLNHGWRDDIVVFLLRAVPIMPTAPVSIVCGMIKLNLRTYLVSTFLGTLVRNIFYLYLGFTSVGALESLNEGIDSFEKFGYLILLILIAGILLYIYRQRKTDAGLKFLEKKSSKATVSSQQQLESNDNNVEE